MVDNIVSLNSSNFGDSFYYYFYDWQIATKDISCVSDRVSVEALLDPSLSATGFDQSGEVRLYPNPSNGKVHLEINFEAQNDLEVRIVDLTGKILLNENISSENNVELNLNHLAKGIYIVQVIDEENVYSGRVVLQ